MTDLMELASRVEAGQGPDRELDAAIALACGIVRERDGNCFYGHKDFSVMVLERGYYDHDGHPPELPAYTASLDAAMTLVPEEYGFQVDGYKREWWASLSAEDGFNASARTPALALTAAALRARAHQGAAHVDQ